MEIFFVRDYMTLKTNNFSFLKSFLVQIINIKDENIFLFKRRIFVPIYISILLLEKLEGLRIKF